MSRYLPLILFTVLTNAAAQILLKRGMMSLGPISLGDRGVIGTTLAVFLNPFVLAGFITFAISMVTHLIVLSRVDVSFAYPFISLAFVIVAVYASLMFGETISLARMVGIALICVGTVFVAQS